MTVTVREAAEADVPALASLITELGYQVRESDVARRLQALAGAGQPVLVADDAGVTGCLTWNMMTVLHRDTQVGRISMLVVASDRRSRGIGRRLVAEAEARMVALGCTLIEVTSNEKRVEAHRFYQRLGYGRTSLRFAKVLEREATDR
jgi:ribosomal protein S18 acetylase RimI-like enzyme